MTYVTWFLMLLPPAGGKALPVYVQPYTDAVTCQVRIIELREQEPGKLYECRAVKAPADLSRPPRKF